MPEGGAADIVAMVGGADRQECLSYYREARAVRT